MTSVEKELENSSEIPQKGRELPYDPEIPLLGIHPQKLKTGTITDRGVPTFIAALFTSIHQQVNG